MDVAMMIRSRLAELGLEQRDLARAAQVTESYVSQLLTRKKAPPAPERTDIYDRMDRFLKLPHGELARLVAQTLLHVAGLGGDVLHVTPRQRVRLDASVASWEWNPATFALAVRLAGGEHKHFAYAERDPVTGNGEKGMAEFLRDTALSGSATPAELAFLKSLRFKDRRPTALYYYRELQNLRDPLHFRL